MCYKILRKILLTQKFVKNDQVHDIFIAYLHKIPMWNQKLALDRQKNLIYTLSKKLIIPRTPQKYLRNSICRPSWECRGSDRFRERRGSEMWSIRLPLFSAPWTAAAGLRPTRGRWIRSTRSPSRQTRGSTAGTIPRSGSAKIQSWK